MYCVLRGYSYNHELARRVIAYKVDEAGYQHSGPADDVMKDFVYENLGAGAIAARQITKWGFTIQRDLSVGTNISKQASFNNLLETLQEISADSHTTEATATYFGMVPLNNGWDFEFRTHIGQWGNDHRNGSGPSGINGAQGGVILSLGRQNIDQASLIHSSAEERTHIYGLGQDEGVARVVQEASDPARIGKSPLNRIEDTVNANNSALAADVLAAAQARLREGRPRRSFQATITETPGTVYGKHWGLGDYLTAEFAGIIMDCRADVVTVRIADGDENITTYIRSES